MTAQLAALHAGPEPLVLPNAWDVASALLLEDAGFAAVGTTSLGVTAAAGVRDGAGAGRELTVTLARRLAPRLRVPLTVDLEDGYSERPEEVVRLAQELREVGVAGVNLEDGRADGTLREVAAHAAVVAAVHAAVPDLFVNARTDVHWLRVGPPERRLAESSRRLSAYADAGASCGFVPGLADVDALAQLAGQVRLPLNVLWSSGLDLAALAAAGVRRVSTGSALYRHALGSALALAADARQGRPAEPPTVGYDHVQALISS